MFKLNSWLISVPDVNVPVLDHIRFTLEKVIDNFVLDCVFVVVGVH